MVMGLELKTRWIGFTGNLHCRKSSRTRHYLQLAGNNDVAVGRPARMVLQVTHDSNEALKAGIYSIDQGFVGDWVDSITVHDSTVKFMVGMLQLSYEGKLGSDGNTITGTWTQGAGTPFIFRRSTKATAWSIPKDPSSHKVQFITLEPGVKLEVLDCGGTGQPLVFLASLGDTAHRFDSVAPNFTGKYHVYGITFTVQAVL